MAVDLFPVCAPGMVTPDKPLACPADLAHHTLLHEESWDWKDGPVPGWEMWLKAIGETNSFWKRKKIASIKYISLLRNNNKPKRD